MKNHIEKVSCFIKIHTYDKMVRRFMCIICSRVYFLKAPFTWPKTHPVANLHTGCIFAPECKKVNRNVQEEPPAEAAANPRHQEEEKK